MVIQLFEHFIATNQKAILLIADILLNTKM